MSVLNSLQEWLKKIKGEPPYMENSKEDRDEKREQLLQEEGFPEEMSKDPEDWESPEEKEEPQIVNEAAGEIALTSEEREELRGHPYATETKTR